MVEILSPAGDFNSVQAAVRSGANAVYLGLGSFNARRNAENFNNDNLKSTVEYCHIRGVKVYITLNTLVFDCEFNSALSVAVTAAKSGVDAFIVQDLGLASALKTVLPNIPLHASTQMSVHSESALYLLKDMGFTRVVVARELDKTSLNKICTVAKTLNLETEVFVHGALCMCMSGQCYLSSVLGSRSGNRGLCAQPCRLAFSVKNGTGYDLSLKDLSLIPNIPELINMGVTSLKIEGRMKRAEYVAIATSVCRDTADGKQIDLERTDMLNKIFSRNGFTNGYFENNLGKNMFGIRQENASELTKEVINKIHNIYRTERQSVPLIANLTVLNGEPSKLCLFDGINKTTVTGAVPQPAVTAPITEEFAKLQIGKTGGTPYYLKDFTLVCNGNITLPSAELKNLRRTAINNLNILRSAQTEPVVKPFNKTVQMVTYSKPEYFARFSNINQIPANLNGIKAIILPLENGAVTYKTNLPLYADIPRGILNKEQEILNLLIKAKANGIKGAFCGNLAAVELCKKAGVTPFGDFGLNICNNESLNKLSNFNIPLAVVSFENSVENINKLQNKNVKKGIICYGKIPLMLTRNCPNKNGNGCKNCNGSAKITDRLGIEFPLMCRMGFTELLNSRPLYVVDRINEFKIDFGIVYFTNETKEEAEEIINMLNTNQILNCEYTRGLYYRQVK